MAYVMVVIWTCYTKILSHSSKTWSNPNNMYVITLMQLLSSRLTFDFLCCNRILSLRSIDIVGIGSASWVKFVTGLLATPYPASLTIEPNPFRILIRIAHILWIFSKVLFGWKLTVCILYLTACKDKNNYTRVVS